MNAATEIAVTVFDNLAATSCKSKHVSFDRLAEQLRHAKTFQSKADCPLLKMATFGYQRTKENCLRHDANVIEISGIEGDYDGGKVSLADARSLLSEHQIRAVLYTSPRHTAEKPRWRVLCPLSKPHAPSERARLVARLNGALGGILGEESFVLSQSFYFGRVAGAPYETAQVSGTCIDLLANLDAGAIHPPKNREPRNELPGNEIPEGERDSTLTSLAGSMRRRGMTYEEILAALLVVNTKRCNPPLDEAQVEKIARSVSQYKPSANLLTVHPLTIGGNAARLVDEAHDRLRYCPQFKNWLYWDGVRWCPDADGVASREMQSVVAALYQAAGAEKDPERRKAAMKWAMTSDTAHAIRDSVQLAQVDRRIIVDAAVLDADPWVLGVRNGILDLRTGRLLSPDPRRLITKQSGAAFDPRAECPIWHKFLKTIFADDAKLIAFLRQAVGYTLSGITTEKCLYFLYGARGDNGKSTFVETLLALLGDYSHKTRAETFMAAKFGKHGATPEVMALRGARLVAMSELSDRQRWDDSFLKDVTGGVDQIAGRNLYEREQQFKPVLKLWGYGNNKPALRADDNAAWRRMRLIPFLVRIADVDQDKALGEKLRAELPGVLNWALAGCLEWQRKGMSVPDVVHNATSGYRDEQDVLAQFIEECCTQDVRATVEIGALYEAYEQWSAGVELRYPLTKFRFLKQLEDRDFRKGKGAHNVKRIGGLKLKES